MFIHSIVLQTRTQDVLQSVDSQTEPFFAIIVAVFGILLFGFILTRLSQLFAKRVIKRELFDPSFKRLSSLNVSAKKVVVNSVGVVGYTVTPLFALNYLGVLRNVLVVVGVVLLFASVWGGVLFLRDYTVNFLAKRKIVVAEGAPLKIGCVEGEVVSCEDYYLVVDTNDGHQLCVPYEYVRKNS